MYGQNGQWLRLVLKIDRQVLKISPKYPTLRLTDETHLKFQRMIFPAEFVKLFRH